MITCDEYHDCRCSDWQTGIELPGHGVAMRCEGWWSLLTDDNVLIACGDAFELTLKRPVSYGILEVETPTFFGGVSYTKRLTNRKSVLLKPD